MITRLHGFPALAVVFFCAMGLHSSRSAAAAKPQPAPAWALDVAKTATPFTVNDAVLFDEYLITVDERNHAVERERFAVRILKPQGRKYAHCEASYDTDAKLNSFRSWTITPDGHQFQAMETDFIDHGAYAGADMQFTERVRGVNPPASDPGSVVVCETEGGLRPYMSEEDWDIQAPIPVVFEALELARAALHRRRRARDVAGWRRRRQSGGPGRGRDRQPLGCKAGQGLPERRRTGCGAAAPGVSGADHAGHAGRGPEQHHQRRAQAR